MVVSKDRGAAVLGLSGKTSGTLPASLAQTPYRKSGGPAFNALKPGDLIAVKPMGGSTYALRSVPEVSGGMMVQAVRTGRIYAMQGGFDSSLSSYNRVTQAQRQPGSTIKPFVYAAALDNGITPATIIVDGCFVSGSPRRWGRNASRTSTRAGAGRTRCAGASSNRAT